MKDLQNLLNQVSIITKKNDEFLDATGGRFNIFSISGVNHYENTHSAILAELLNPKGSHGLKSKFLQAFIGSIELKDELKDFDCENANVKTEAPTESSEKEKETLPDEYLEPGKPLCSPIIVRETGSVPEIVFILFQTAESGLHDGNSIILRYNSFPLRVEKRICQCAGVFSVSFHKNSGAGNSGGKIVPSPG